MNARIQLPITWFLGLTPPPPLFIGRSSIYRPNERPTLAISVTRFPTHFVCILLHIVCRRSFRHSQVSFFCTRLCTFCTQSFLERTCSWTSLRWFRVNSLSIVVRCKFFKYNQLDTWLVAHSIGIIVESPNCYDFTDHTHVIPSFERHIWATEAMTGSFDFRQ